MPIPNNVSSLGVLPTAVQTTDAPFGSPSSARVKPNGLSFLDVMSQHLSEKVLPSPPLFPEQVNLNIQRTEETNREMPSVSLAEVSAKFQTITSAQQVQTPTIEIKNLPRVNLAVQANPTSIQTSDLSSGRTSSTTGYFSTELNENPKSLILAKRISQLGFTYHQSGSDTSQIQDLQTWFLGTIPAVPSVPNHAVVYSQATTSARSTTQSPMVAKPVVQTSPVAHSNPEPSPILTVEAKSVELLKSSSAISNQGTTTVRSAAPVAQALVVAKPSIQTSPVAQSNPEPSPVLTVEAKSVELLKASLAVSNQGTTTVRSAAPVAQTPVVAKPSVQTSPLAQSSPESSRVLTVEAKSLEPPKPPLVVSNQGTTTVRSAAPAAQAPMMAKTGVQINLVAQSNPEPSPVLTVEAKSVEPPKPPLVGVNQGITTVRSAAPAAPVIQAPVLAKSVVQTNPVMQSNLEPSPILTVEVKSVEPPKPPLVGVNQETTLTRSPTPAAPVAPAEVLEKPSVQASPVAQLHPEASKVSTAALPKSPLVIDSNQKIIQSTTLVRSVAPVAQAEVLEKPSVQTNPVPQSNPESSPVLTVEVKSVKPPKPPLVGVNQGITSSDEPTQLFQVISSQNLLPEGTPVFTTGIASATVVPQITVPEAGSVELVRTVLSKSEIGSSSTSEGNLQSTSDESVPSLGKSKNIPSFISEAVQQDTTTSAVTPSFSQFPSGRTDAVSPETPLPLGSPQLETELGQRVHWAVQHQTQQVELRVTPPNLGPLDLQIGLKDGQALVSFTTPHAVVRDAIETALPKLREMLEGQGLRLADAGVHQQGSGNGTRGERWQPQQTPWGEQRPLREDSPSEPLLRRNPILSRGRKIDYFA